MRDSQHTTRVTCSLDQAQSSDQDEILRKEQKPAITGDEVRGWRCKLRPFISHLTTPIETPPHQNTRIPHNASRSRIWSSRSGLTSSAWARRKRSRSSNHTTTRTFTSCVVRMRASAPPHTHTPRSRPTSHTLPARTHTGTWRHSLALTFLSTHPATVTACAFGIAGNGGWRALPL